MWLMSRCCRCAKKIVCEIYSSIFSTDTISEWTQYAGTWSITSGTLQVTGPGLIIQNNAGQKGEGVVKVQATAALGQTVRILGAAVDDQNYLYGEVEFSGSGHILKIGRVEAGVDTVLKTTLTIAKTTSGTTILEFCWNSDYIAFRVGVIEAICHGQAIGSGRKAGLEVVSSGAFQFDNWTYSHSSREKIESACQQCAPCAIFCREWPDTVAVTLPSGWTNTSPVRCNACSALAGNYILNRYDGNVSDLGIAYCPIVFDPPDYITPTGVKANAPCTTYIYSESAFCTSGTDVLDLHILVRFTSAAFGSSADLLIQVDVILDGGEACSATTGARTIWRAVTSLAVNTMPKHQDCDGSIVRNFGLGFGRFACCKSSSAPLCNENGNRPVVTI